MKVLIRFIIAIVLLSAPFAQNKGRESFEEKIKKQKKILKRVRKRLEDKDVKKDVFFNKIEKVCFKYEPKPEKRYGGYGENGFLSCFFNMVHWSGKLAPARRN